MEFGGVFLLDDTIAESGDLVFVLGGHGDSVFKIGDLSGSRTDNPVSLGLPTTRK